MLTIILALLWLIPLILLLDYFIVNLRYESATGLEIISVLFCSMCPILNIAMVFTYCSEALNEPEEKEKLKKHSIFKFLYKSYKL